MNLHTVFIRLQAEAHNACFIIPCSLQSSATYIFSFILSKGLDEAQPFLFYVLSTKLFVRILFSSASRAHPSQDGLWWTEGSCSHGRPQGGQNGH